MKYTEEIQTRNFMLLLEDVNGTMINVSQICTLDKQGDYYALVLTNGKSYLVSKSNCESLFPDFSS
jgi:hypothetical protein